MNRAVEFSDVATRPSSAAERLDALPVGSFHYRLIGVIGAGLFLDAFELALASGVLGTLVKEGWSNLKLNGYFVTATFMGFMIGCWAAGIIGDRLGRKFSYQANLAIFGLASLAATFAPNIETLIGLRFLMGIGLGAELVLGYATLAEFVPPQRRGRLVALLSFIAQCGIFVSSVVSLWVIPNFGWRAMFAIAGIAAIFVWFLRKFMPESPRWLEQQGRHAEADAILTEAERQAGVVPRSAKAVSALAPAQASVQPAKATIGTLFSEELRRRTFVAVVTLCVIQVCLYGLVTWLPTFFVQQGFSVVKSLQWNTVMTLGGPAGGLIGLLLADKAGRKPILMTAALAAIALSVVYVNLTTENLLMMVGFLLITAIYVIVVVGQAVYVSELFPTAVRMRGTGLSSTVARVVAASIQFAIPPLFAAGGVTAIVTAVAAALVLLTLVIGFVGVETKERSLEQISV